MKKCILSIVVLLVCMQLGMQAQDTIRIMTFNIDQGSDTTLQAIGEVIRSYNPDFVALQEVDICPKRNYVPHQRGKNFITELGYYTNMQGIFGKAMDHPGGWEYGDAILTKHSFTQSCTYSLPSSDGIEPRQMILIHTSVHGTPICFACTHLSYENTPMRAAQLRKIKQILSKQKEKIQFICGDFNSDPSENLIPSILKQWTDVLPEGKGTFTSMPHNALQAYKYDYILYNSRRTNNIEIFHSSIHCDEHLTDHCIGIAEIIIH